MAKEKKIVCMVDSYKKGTIAVSHEIGRAHV